MSLSTREKYRLRRLYRRIRVAIKRELPLKYDKDGHAVLLTATELCCERYKHLMPQPKVREIPIHISFTED